MQHWCKYFSVFRCFFVFYKSIINSGFIIVFLINKSIEIITRCQKKLYIETFWDWEKRKRKSVVGYKRKSEKVRERERESYVWIGSGSESVGGCVCRTEEMQICVACWSDAGNAEVMWEKQKGEREGGGGA